MKPSVFKWCSASGLVLMGAGFAAATAGFVTGEASAWLSGAQSVASSASAADGEIRSVEINLSAGDVSVISGEKLSVDISGGLNKRCDASVQDGKLIVENKPGAWPDWFGDSGTVRVTLPSGGKLDSFRADLLMGDFDIEDITADDMQVGIKLGDASFRSVGARRLSILSEAGDADLERLAVEESFTLTVSAGDADIQGDLRGMIDLKAGAGDIRAGIGGDRGGYALDLSASLGSIRLDGRELNDGIGARRQENDGATNTLRAHAAAGDIDITFQGKGA